MSEAARGFWWRPSASILCAALAACGGRIGAPVETTASVPVAGTTIMVLSGRADMVTGGSTLVEVALPAGVSARSLRIMADSVDVTSAFATRRDGRMIGLITGLADGANMVTATATDGSFAGARLTLTNHANRPVLVARQQGPWICATPVPIPATETTPATRASGLAAMATDLQCTIPTEKKLFYRTQVPESRSKGDGGCRFVVPDPSPTAAIPVPTTPPESCFQRFVPGSTPASAIAVTTPLGAAVTIPYIVRVERGTINRGIYDVAVLFDPAQPWTAVAPQLHWTGKVVHQFGGGTSQTRLQARSTQNWADDKLLSRGVMVVDHSLTDSGSNSNRVLVAETVMMMKEHVAKTYGVIRYYAGNGCSGGSINQAAAASIFPGLLDGLQVQCSYPDIVTGFLEAADCTLLVHFYAGPRWAALTRQMSAAEVAAKKAAINGHVDQTGCHAWNNAYGSINKPGNYVPILVADDAGSLKPGTPANNCALPRALVYDRVRHPAGLRCDDATHAAAVWGLAPGTARGNGTADNMGVQYGLKALLADAITPEEFVTLNEAIGGVDADDEPQAARTVADPTALATAYRSGIVASGARLDLVPIIDLRVFDDSTIMGAPFGFHHVYRSWSVRDRLDREGGGHANQIIWRFGNDIERDDWLAGRSAPASLMLDQFLTMDAWLSAMPRKVGLNDAHTSATLLAAKPANAFDHCYLSGDPGLTAKVTDTAACDADPRLRSHASPRQVAGGPRAENVLKCALKPIDFRMYPGVIFTAGQRSRLLTTFANGVCDYTRPGIGQQPPQSPLGFVTRPGGIPLPRAPRSMPM